MGTLYPEFRYAGNSTTGLVLTLSTCREVSNLRVYCQVGGKLPPASERSNVGLRRIWRHNDAPSIVRLLLWLWRDRRSFDLIIFNTYLTAFGRSRVANALGALLPTLAAATTGRPVTVYLHNLLETQDVKKLGYAPGRLEAFVTHVLEMIMFTSTNVVLPLSSQRETVWRVFHRRVSANYIPYLEGIASLEAHLDLGKRVRKRSPSELGFHVGNGIGPPRAF